MSKNRRPDLPRPEHACGRALARLAALAVAACVAVASIPSAAGSSWLESKPPEVTYEEQRFWVKDTNYYRSVWYAGAHRKMINFGCTRAPYYPPSPRCDNELGFHHGLDIAMPCGTRLFAGFRGFVVYPSSPGALGSAYGPWAFRIRNVRLGVDVVIGHVRRVYVQPGDRVRRGQLIARASDAGAPDGCHLHFEVRPKAGAYYQAIRPGPYLSLQRVS
jgi:murein DD-endopeptidase MepM/ murein hydrolase activator NlpD